MAKNACPTDDEIEVVMNRLLFMVASSIPAMLFVGYLYE